MAFGYYSAFTVQSSQVPSTQTDFPTLISWTDARFKTVGNGGHVQNASGYDIRPYASDGTTALTFQLVYYNGTTGQVEMWVKVASLANASVVRLYYGDAGLSSDGSSTGTWDTHFKAVWHLADGTSLSLSDSTSGAHTLTNSSATAGAGKVDGGVSYSSGNYVEAANHTDYDSTTGTWSLWIKTSQSVGGGNYPGVMARANNDSRDGISIFLETATGKAMVQVYPSAPGSNVYSQNGGAALNDGAWHKIDFTFQGTSTATIYVDGSSVASASPSGSWGFAGQAIRTARLVDSFWTSFVGTQDEIRVSDSARSADWLTTEWNNQNDQAAFWSLGGEQTVGGAVVRKNDLLAMMQ